MNYLNIFSIFTLASVCFCSLNLFSVVYGLKGSRESRALLSSLHRRGRGLIRRVTLSGSAVRRESEHGGAGGNKLPPVSTNITFNFEQRLFYDL